ncbi:hypothetical protein [Desnuesiella massiliensis]|uniref:hypothetical protein n=1 Tax=Desnuesiella massiliensis TaxID=1650662 RepID=UPI0006E3F842|nr:hypothetical protein [Desnuesiella massiliensis]
MISKQNIINTINSLSNKRKIFFSEADFQFALSWELQRHMPKSDVRLEYSPAHIDPSMRIDILLKEEDEFYPIELKYVTAACDTIVDGERYLLKNHGAQDIRRYDFLKDIMRIEKLIYNHNEYKKGYAIFLTNDCSYWTKSSAKETCDRNFRINQDEIKSGELKWGEAAGIGTKKGREESLLLQGNYKLNWQDYSSISDEKWGKFKILIVEVENSKDITSVTNKYWVYENWVAEKKAVIHKDSCVFCNHGKGNNKNIHGNRNGKWHGEFSSFVEAEKFANTLKDREIRTCKKCII